MHAVAAQAQSLARGQGSRMNEAYGIRASRLESLPNGQVGVTGGQQPVVGDDDESIHLGAKPRHALQRLRSNPESFSNEAQGNTCRCLRDA